VTTQVTGFIASVYKPRDLKVIGNDEQVGVDLFVNGRLRERDILKRIPTARVAESYLYGQIHYNALDDETDRFTSSREGIVADDPKYQALLHSLRTDIVPIILEQWDQFRRKARMDGDSDNPTITKKDRKSEELFNAVSTEYKLPKGSKNKAKIQKWVDSLHEEAKFNLGSYAECFVSENLLRKYIVDQKMVLSKEAKDEAAIWKKREAEAKDKANISIDIRKSNDDMMYLSMDSLANFIDKKDLTQAASLSRDAREYKPVRDSMAHTALLTDVAKAKLSSVYSNIKGRLVKLLER
jgi:hypothetical protein